MKPFRLSCGALAAVVSAVFFCGHVMAGEREAQDPKRIEYCRPREPRNNTTNYTWPGYGEVPAGFVRHTRPQKSMLLKVLTYNINGIPTGNFKRYERVGRLLCGDRHEGVSPDIVLLQEAFVNEADDVQKFSGYPYVAAGPAGDRFNINSGLRILSDFKIIEKNLVTYNECSGLDCYSNKGGMHTRLYIPGLPVPLEVFNTHMNAEVEEESVRDSQVVQFSRLIRDKTAFGFPAIIGGDFNYVGDSNNAMTFLNLSGGHHAGLFCMQTSCKSSGKMTPQRSYFNEGSDYFDHQYFLDGDHPRVTITPVEFHAAFETYQFEGDLLSDHIGQEIHYRLTWDDSEEDFIAPMSPLALKNNNEAE